MNWTDERVEQLKKLWSDGLSASQIAAELGGITRNAVIGKVHRLGLSGRAKAPSSSAAAAAKAARHPHAARPRPRCAAIPRWRRPSPTTRDRNRPDAGRECHSDRAAPTLLRTQRADLPLAGRRPGQPRNSTSAAAAR